jgi:hypothetical protein
MTERTNRPDQMKLMRAAQIIALAALVFLTLTNIYELKQLIGTPSAANEDDVGPYVQRLERVRPLLPDSGRIGYITDVPVENIPLSPHSETLKKRYALTQYALAPRALRPGTDEAIIIGSFSSSATAAVATKELTVIRDLGDGLMLLRKQKD